ncbi:MAG: hypothetical protein IJ574_03000 [Bacilli bacterium]|nr:hypothetical protein [Bacilli bacterium]
MLKRNRIICFLLLLLFPSITHAESVCPDFPSEFRMTNDLLGDLHSFDEYYEKDYDNQIKNATDASLKAELSSEKQQKLNTIVKYYHSNILQYNAKKISGNYGKVVNGVQTNYEINHPLYADSYYILKYTDRIGTINEPKVYGYNIDPAKDMLDIDTWWCTREIDPTNLEFSKNTNRFDMALYYLNNKWNELNLRDKLEDGTTRNELFNYHNILLTNNPIVAEFVVKFLAYYYDMAQDDQVYFECGSQSCNQSNAIGYRERHDAFVKFIKDYGNYKQENHKQPNFDCKKDGWVFCNYNSLVDEEHYLPDTYDYLTEAFKMFEKAHKYADNEENYKDTDTIKAYLIDENYKTTRQYAGVWTFEQKEPIATEYTKINKPTVDENGDYVITNTQAKNLRLSTTMIVIYDKDTTELDRNDFNNDHLSECIVPYGNCSMKSEKMDKVYKYDKNGNIKYNGDGTEQIDETKDGFKITYTVEGDFRNIAGQNFSVKLAIPYKFKKNFDRMIVLNQASGIATDKVNTSSARLIGFFENSFDSKNNIYFEFSLPKIANDCTILDSNGFKQYTFNGDVVDEPTYFANGCCNAYKDKYYDETRDSSPYSNYSNYCGSCETKSSLADNCDNYSYNAGITGPTNTYACFFGKDKDKAVDEKGNSYILDGFKNNNYCTVYCKEDYTFRYGLSSWSSAQTNRTESGGSYKSIYKDKYLLNLTGTKTCYEKSNSNNMISDINQTLTYLVNAYTNYSKYYNLYNTNNGGCDDDIVNGINQGEVCSKTINYDNCTYDSINKTVNCQNTTNTFETRYITTYSPAYYVGDYNPNTLKSDVDSAKANVWYYQNKLKSIIEQINNCSGWYDNLDLKEPNAYYTYDESYIDLLNKKIAGESVGILEPSLNKDKLVKLWECSAPVGNITIESKIESKFNNCSNYPTEYPSEERENADSIRYSLYDLSSINSSSCSNCNQFFSDLAKEVRIPTNNYIKATITKEIQYKPKQQYQVYLGTDINNIGKIKAYNGTLDDENYEIFTNGLPISSSTPNGTYDIKIFIENLGEFYDTGNTGRLIGTENEHSKSLLDNAPYVYACTYNIGNNSGGGNGGNYPSGGGSTDNGPCSRSVTDSSGKSCCIEKYYANHFKCTDSGTTDDDCNTKDRYGVYCCKEKYNSLLNECEDVAKEELKCCNQSTYSKYNYYLINGRYYRSWGISSYYYETTEDEYKSNCSLEDFDTSSGQCNKCLTTIDASEGECCNRECCQDKVASGEMRACDFSNCPTESYVVDGKGTKCCSDKLKIDSNKNTCCEQNYKNDKCDIGSTGGKTGSTDDDNGGCDSLFCTTECFGNNCSTSDVNLNVNFKQVSLDNPDPNPKQGFSSYYETDKYNSMKKSEEATYQAEAEYKFELTPSIIRQIREDNNKNGYTNDTLSCYDIVGIQSDNDVQYIIDTTNQYKNDKTVIKYKNVVCTSSYLDGLLGSSNRDISKLFKTWLQSDECTSKKCIVADGVGPAWK